MSAVSPSLYVFGAKLAEVSLDLDAQVGAADMSSSCLEAGVIQRLDEAVVNRIAAGEVVQRPANALKEMLENCLDAKSTQISVTVKQGGLKLLQIQDNGTGIRKSDLDIVCERFTTSKLKEFSDLQQINTYGFRGEALASISHVAHLSILTKTKDDPCAWKCIYLDGKPKAPAKPCAGNQGTQITVEDLFYNVSIRRKALRSPAEEHARIAEVVSRYAVHNASVGFSLKKQGENCVDLRTPPNSSSQENIRIVFGSAIANELLPVSFSDDRLQFKCSGLVTNANYSCKRGVMLLFINHRLVDSLGIRKAIEGVYAAYLPKHTHPFIYLSLEIAPQNVDVNMHPTKHEVSFLHEEAIIETISKAVDEKLLGSNQSRTFYTQSLLPDAVGLSVGKRTGEETSSSKDDTGRVYDHSLVRTNAKDQKLTKFFTRNDEGCADDPSKVDANSQDSQVTASTSSSSQQPSKRRQLRLTSVCELLKEVNTRCHSGLQDILKNHTFVGCVDEHLALIQHNTSLYLTRTQHLCEQMFYQMLLKDFGNHGVIKLSTPASLSELAVLALDQPESGWNEADGSKESLADYIKTFLSSKSAMLEDYFSIKIDDEGNLCSIPYLIDDFVPAMTGLPLFVVRLTTEVNWDTEVDCFRSLCQEISHFYASPPLAEEEDPVEKESGAQTHWSWMTEQLLYPALREHLQPPQHLAHDTSVLEIADLHKLYKVFERC
ncbi:DNA mismatch repair protein family [Trinorchestia longiramus]|nr:DNA mismatch repair protein family [Trinorchestia longiramus]